MAQPPLHPSDETAPPESSVDSEVLDLRYGSGRLLWLDSDDIDELIASGQTWMPPAAEPATREGNQPAPRKAA